MEARRNSVANIPACLALPHSVMLPIFERTKDLPQVDAKHQYAPDVEPLPEINSFPCFLAWHPRFHYRTCPRTVSRTTADSCWGNVSNREIGRASCRERV